MNHLEHIARLEQQIAELEARRGTADTLPNIEALIATLQRTRAWHLRRSDRSKKNVARVSLYGRCEAGRSTRRKPHPYIEAPLAGLGL